MSRAPTVVLQSTNALRRRKRKSVRLRHRLAGDLAVADIEAVTVNGCASFKSLAPTLVGNLQREGAAVALLSAKVDVRATVSRHIYWQRNNAPHPSTTKVGLECVVGLEVSLHSRPGRRLCRRTRSPCFIVFSIVSSSNEVSMARKPPA